MVLVVRQDHLRFRAKEIGIPDAQQGQDYRDIAGKRRLPEVAVHVVGAAQKLHKIIKAHEAGDG